MDGVCIASSVVNRETFCLKIFLAMVWLVSALY